MITIIVASSALPRMPNATIEMYIEVWKKDRRRDDVTIDDDNDDDDDEGDD